MTFVKRYGSKARFWRAFFVGGKLTYEAVAEAHGMEYTPLDDALAAAVG